MIVVLHKRARRTYFCLKKIIKLTHFQNDKCQKLKKVWLCLQKKMCVLNNVFV